MPHRADEPESFQPPASGPSTCTGHIEARPSSTRFKTALALSGGAARALSHVGVLEAVERSAFPVDMIAGSSMGAIIGGLYACYGSARAVEERLERFLRSRKFQRALSLAVSEREDGAGSLFDQMAFQLRKGLLVTRSVTRESLVPLDDYMELMSELIPDEPIETLGIPFGAVALDLLTGEEVLFRKGSLRTAICASAAIPGVLPPISHRGRSLVDGGWVDNVPAMPAIFMGAHFVVAVDAGWDVRELIRFPTSAMEIAFRSNDIARIELNRHRSAVADVLLKPQLVDVSWSEFNAMKRCVTAGREAWRQNLRSVRARRLQRWFRTAGGRLHPGRKNRWKRPVVVF